MTAAKKSSLDKLLALGQAGPQLEQLVDTLRAKGVTRLRVDDIEIELAAEAPAGEAADHPIEGDKRPEYDSDYDNPLLYPGGEVPTFGDGTRGDA